MTRRSFKRALGIFWWVTLLFLYAPLLVVMFYSFNSINSSARWGGFSLRWYRQLAGNEVIIAAIGNTLVLAIVSSLIAVAIGALTGYGLYRHRARRLGLLIALVYLPIVMPDIVFGIADMTFFVGINRLTGLLSPGLATMVIAHVTFQIPFVALLVYSRLVGLDATLFDAAKDLYASPAQRALHFLLPTLRPALLSAFFLSFTLSVDDFVISFFTAGPESATLPIYIWGAIRRGVSPEINAIATLMIAAVALVAVISLALGRHRGRA
ncbi:ABC transporter permease [Kushneria aurantia]|uniref:ABC transporter permease n=1 Tax=Kushneria aurantia TaxID=504092 RepID=A0ABV6G3P2_9GAMM|nr:ABC transporter permease [Kushneria aurantia]